jgi:tape measure domain-containing protein
MIVRELITRLGFKTDQREADKYERLLNKLRAGADKAATKAASDETKRLQQLARAEAATARMRGAQAKAIQEAQKREAQLEAQRQAARQRQERFDRSQERFKATAARSEQRHLQQLNSARIRNDDMARRRAQQTQQMNDRNDQRSLRAIQVRLNAQRRADQMHRASAMRISQAAVSASTRLAQLQSRHAAQQIAQGARLHGVQMRNAATQRQAQQRLQDTILNGQHRQQMNAARMAAFDARQAALRRAEILRENNLRAAGRRRSSVGRRGEGGGLGGAFGGALGVGVGALGVADAAGRIDSMTAVNTRMDMVFDPAQATSRNARLQQVALNTGVNKSVLGDIAYKTMRAKDSIGMGDLTQERVLNIAEAVGTDAAMSGSSPEATNAALIQLFQGIESDRLGGQELNSVREQLPTVARTLMKQLGFTNMGQLRAKAAEKGVGKGLTGKMVLGALEASYPEVAEKQKHIPMTFARSLNKASEMWNFFLLDIEKGAHLTKQFDTVLIGLVGTLFDGIKRIVVSLGGWQRAANVLIAIVGGALIPLMIKLGASFLAWMGPLALLALPLSLLFDSLLEFARKYPEEWKAGTDKMKEALGNLVDSILYAMGARLKPFQNSNAQPLGAVSLTNKGNGVVAYNGKEYKTDDAALGQAILADHPEWAEKFKESGGRIRVSTGGKFTNELQTLKGGEAAMGLDWGSIIGKVAENIQKLADWFQGEGKTKADDALKQLTRIGDLLSDFLRLINGGGSVSSPNGANFADALRRLGSDNSLSTGLGLGPFISAMTSSGLGAIQDGLHRMTGEDKNNLYLANQSTSANGATGTWGSTSIDKVEVNVHMPQKPTEESFIKNIGNNTRKALNSATGGGQSAPLGMFPIENTSRPVE